jgi:MFS transporter
VNRPIITIGKISRSPWITLAILSCVGLIAMFADTMILPAIPDIIKDFKISYSTSSWILASFLITGAVMTPVAGRLSDMYGKKKMLRKLMLDGFTGERQKNTDRLGTVHDLLFVIFDNDTRVIFASTFDGDWDPYIDDFATIIPDEIDLLFHELEGYPGIHSPNIKDWIAKHQVTATAFYSALMIIVS